MLKEPQLINGTHLCHWSKASDKSKWEISERWPCTPGRALWDVQKSGFYFV